MGDQSPLRVFISYRREDSAGHAGRLHDALCARLDAAEVFIDVGGIEPGTDFAQAIAEAVGRCDVMLPLIGTRWTTAASADGSRRLDDPDDYVATEIAVALERGIRVIPLLIDGTPMPQPAEIPERIRPLARRNSMTLNTISWPRDLEALVAVLARLSPEPAPLAADPAPADPGSGPLPRAEAGGREHSAPTRSAWVVRGLLGVVALLLVVLVTRYVTGRETEDPLPPGTGSTAAAPGPAGAPGCYERLPKVTPPGNIAVLEEGARNLDFRPGAGLQEPLVIRFTRDNKIIGAMQFTYIPASRIRRISTVVEGDSCSPVRGYKNFETRNPTDTYIEFAEMCLPLGGTTYRVRFNVVEDRGVLILELEQVSC